MIFRAHQFARLCGQNRGSTTSPGIVLNVSSQSSGIIRSKYIKAIFLEFCTKNGKDLQHNETHEYCSDTRLFPNERHLVAALFLSMCASAAWYCMCLSKMCHLGFISDHFSMRWNSFSIVGLWGSLAVIRVLDIIQDMGGSCLGFWNGNVLHFWVFQACGGEVRKHWNIFWLRQFSTNTDFYFCGQT